MNKSDVIVVGAGHAGIEACIATSKLGLKTIVFTVNADNIGCMPCNPSIGGPAKSHLVCEIDALGGIMGEVADSTYIQKRMLNTRKGPAVRSIRAQIDKKKYQAKMKQILENTPNLKIIQSIVDEIIVEDEKVKGIIANGIKFYSETVIIATGTFLNGKIHIGKDIINGGRFGEISCKKLSDSLKKNNINLIKFKTGTPPRINKKSLDLSKLQIQVGEESEGLQFSKSTKKNIKSIKEQKKCFIAYTNENMHSLIKDNIKDAPLFNGQIDSIGPRYCPSIEDKVVRFADKTRHHIFVEPEGEDTIEMYPNGVSTSLPAKIQHEMLCSIVGFENVEIIRFGYAIEYDCIRPYEELTLSLESKKIKNLFFAGQINGTSGYEEAACQGLIAGINASLKIKNKDSLILKRSSSYIGTLIDDLINKDINEPYRMFTARSEFRLLLRQDNADIRLSKIGYELGLLDKERYEHLEEKINIVEKEKERLKDIFVDLNNENIKKELKKIDIELSKKSSLYDLLKRPKISYQNLKLIFSELKSYSYDIEYQIDVQIKYEGYIKRQEKHLKRFSKLENKLIPENMEYTKISGLRNEAMEKLNKIKPKSIGQALRIGGVSLADVSIVMLNLMKSKK